MQEVRDQSEDQVQEVRTKAESEIARAKANQEKADNRIAKADARRMAAEKRSKELEKQIRKACLQLDMNEQEADRICREVAKNTDNKIEIKINGTNQRVNDLSQFAAEVLQASHDSLEIMHNQHKAAIGKADERTDSRSRFQEMCALSKMRGELKMSHTEYYFAKQELMTTWQKQWAPSERATFTPPKFMSKTMPSNGAHGGALAENFFNRGYEQQPSPSTCLNATLLPSQVPEDAT